MFDSVATPLFLTVVLIVLTVFAVYGFLEPRRFPCMASLLARFGLQPKADAVVVTITDFRVNDRDGKLPPGDLSVQFKCGSQAFEARANKNGEFESSCWVDIERRIVTCEVILLLDNEPAVVKSVKATELLLAAKKAPNLITVRLPGGDGGEPLGTVTLRVEFPATEKTPLLDSLNQDSRRLKAAVATSEISGQEQEVEVLQKLLHGPITCLGNDAKWCKMENRPRGGKSLWFWCFYKSADASEQLWVLPVASIVEIRGTSRDSFEVTARDQMKKETLFFRVPGEVGIWVEGLKALRDSARHDENIGKRKTWLGMDGAQRSSTWQSYADGSKNV